MRDRPALVLVAIAVVALAVFGISKVTGSSTHTIQGTLTIEGSDNFGSSGGACSGSGGYSDLDAGTDVTVTDGAGKTIGVGSLEAGSETSGSCELPFTIDEVPAADIYEVSAGNNDRGGPHYTSSDMDQNNWTVSLTIGGS